MWLNTSERETATGKDIMLITMTCKCGKQFRIDDSMVGEEIHCMGCGKPMIVAKPGAPASVRRPPPTPRFDDDDDKPQAASTLRMTVPPLPTPPVEESIPAAAPGAGQASLRDFTYWLLALAFFPLAIILGQPEPPGFPDRVYQTLKESHPEVRDKADRLLNGEEYGEIDDLFKLMPGERLVGATYSRFSSIHWLFAGVTILVFAALLGSTFTHGSVPVAHLVGIGLFTGTIGVGILFIVHLSPLGHFIAALHFAAEGQQGNFWTVLMAYTLGVGLIEEGCKSMALLGYLKDRPEIGWRQCCLCGLATGVGFGVAEGIMYSTEFYHGVSDNMTYLVRFASCVTLHALWSASAGITLFHSQELFHFVQREGAKEEIRGDNLTDELMEKMGSVIGRYGIVILRMVAVVMWLHGLYDAALVYDLKLLALLTALASFAWLAWQIEDCRRAEQGTLAAAEE